MLVFPQSTSRGFFRVFQCFLGYRTTHFSVQPLLFLLIWGYIFWTFFLFFWHFCRIIVLVCLVWKNKVSHSDDPWALCTANQQEYCGSRHHPGFWCMWGCGHMEDREDGVGAQWVLWKNVMQNGVKLNVWLNLFQDCRIREEWINEIVLGHKNFMRHHFHKATFI